MDSNRPVDATLRSAVNLADLRIAARRRLPRVLFDFIDGGSGGEVTLRANATQFERWSLLPRQASPVVPATTLDLFGQALAMPILIAPCGSARMVHPDGERALARAAAAAGTVYLVPHMGGTALEAVRHDTVGGPVPWYQLYKAAGLAVAEAAVARAAAAGYAALVLTLDNGIALRERDVRNGLAALTSGNARRLAPHLPQLLARPGWLRRYLGTPERDVFPNVVRDGRPLTIGEIIAASRGVAGNFTWDDIARLRDLWRGPLILKSLLTAADAARALALGADALVVSNHGGRGLDGAPASLDALVEVVATVGGRVPVLVDGGFRRGTDVVKALALGARAVLVGRPTMFGLAFGEPGVRWTLELLRTDLVQALTLLGVDKVAEVGPALLADRSSPHAARPVSAAAAP